MENRGIFTLPQTPIIESTSRKYIPLITADFLSKIVGGNYHCCINTLDSFSNRTPFIEPYIQNISRLGIEFSDIWIDGENIDALLKNIEFLISMGYISEITTSFYRCSCGRVEIEENKIRTCNPNNLNFEFKNGMMHSKCCDSVCHKYEEKVLIFTPYNVSRKDLHFFPDYLNSDSKTYDTTVINSYVTISRKRETGVKINFNGTYYNLDIDFLWSTYMANFDEKQKIVISGNKMMYQLFLVGLLNKILRPEDETILLGTPIILNSSRFITDALDPKIANLAIALNMGWKSKETKFDEGILRKLYKSNSIDLNLIYEIVTTSADSGNNLEDAIRYALTNNFNWPKVLTKLKERKNKNV